MPVSITSVLRSSSLFIDQDGDGLADAGDVVRTTLTFTNSGDTDALNVVVNDLLGGLTETGAVNISPIAFNDAFTAVGNTTLRVGTATNIGSGPSSFVAGNLLSNDVGSTTVGVGALAADDFTGFTINTVASGTSSLGGTFNIFADGTFNYVSQAGDTGVDTFTYTIRDAGFDGIANNADDLTSTATVSITLTGQVWYVDAAAAGGGTGTSNNPFNSITALNNANVDGANDTVYVKGNATGQLVMEQGEKLIGEGAALVVGGFTLATAGARSTLTNSAAGYGVTLAGGGTGNNEISGINIVSTGGTGNNGLTGSSFGTLNVSNATLDASGQALSLTTGTVAGSGFVSTDSDGGVSNVSLVTVGGTLALGTGTLSGATTQNMLISGGSAALTYSGNITQANAGAYLIRGGGAHNGTVTFSTGTLSATNGLGINFDDSDGTYNFNGTTTLNGGDAGIDILNGSIGTFNFGTGTTITNPTGDAFELANSNANVTYSGSISDSTGKAVEIDNHDAGTITFQTGSITSTGSGITVSNSNGGTVNFNGQTALTTTTNTAVDLGTNNAGGTVNFAAAGNGLDIITTSGTGFNGNGGGTISVTGAGNTIATGTGQIISLTGVTVGAGGITFATLGATGTVAATAINLSNVDGGAFSGGNVSIVGTSGAASDGIFIGGGSTSSFTFGTTSINNIGDEGVEINGAGNGAVSFASLTTGATAGNGLEISAGTGSVSVTAGSIGSGNGADALNVTGGTGAVTIGATVTKAGTTGNVVDISGHSVGAIALSGNINASGGTANGMLVQNNTGGTITFSGASKAFTMFANPAVQLTNNTGTTIDFTNGGLAINTSTASGFSATGGGTVSVSGTGNTIISTTGAALNVVSTTIGAADLVFQSISANGAVNGIVLNNTGASGGLTITGTGGANSGGTIQNTTGDAIVATNTQDLNLTNILISAPVGHGINATDLRGINTLTNSTIQNWDTGNTATKDGYHLVNNNTNMTSLVVTGSTFNGSNGSNDGMFMEAQGTSSMALRVESSTFTDMFGDGVEVQSITGSTGTVNVKVLTNNFHTAAALGNGGVQLDPFGGAFLFADINGNTFSDIMRPVTNLGAIGITSGLTAQADITIRNNTLNNIVGARGITATIDGGKTELLIDNNTIDRLGSTSKFAISVNSTNNAGAGTLGNVDVTISNNDIGQAANLWTSGNGLAEAIFVTNQFGATIDALITNNIVTANGSLEIIRARAAGAGLMNVTISNNTVTDTVGTHLEIAVAAGTVGGQPGATINASITGNTVPGGGVGTVTITEGASGTSAADVNIQQASAAAVAAANSGATVTASAGVDFGQAAPTSPTTPTLPASPLFAVSPVPDEPAPAIVAPAMATAMPGALRELPEMQRWLDIMRSDADSPFYGPTANGSMVAASQVSPTDQHDWLEAIELAPADETAAPSAGTASPADVSGPGSASAPSDQPVVVDDGVLSQAELDLIVDAAIARWAAAGATPAQLAAMRAVRLSVADLDSLQLASSQGGAITLDANAAGFSWFIDATPGDDAEYALADGRLVAPGDTQAGVRIDLLTTIMHELGHQIGLEDDYDAADAGSLMYGTINPGVRRLPGDTDVAQATGAPVPATAFALSPIGLGTVPAGQTVTVQWNSTVNAFTNQVIPSFANFSTVSGSNFTSVNSNTQTLSPTSAGIALDSLTLGNLVFNDLNNNGLFDAGDAGINGVALTLFADTNNNGSFDLGTDTQLATATTAGGGLYSFAGLAPGNYIVRVDAANFNAGGALLGNASAVGGGTDPDNNIDHDDNGVVVGAFGAGGYAVSQTITLAHDTEPTNGPGNDTNTTLDFGFANPNDAPVNSLGGTIGTGEDAVNAWLSGMSISDPDANAATDDIRVTFDVDNGTLAILTNVVGGIEAGDIIAQDADTITVQATLNQINATLSAVNGLTYSPNPNYNGSDTLTVTSNDRGFTGTDPGLTGDATSEEDIDTRTITISAADDAPVAQPDAVTTPENVVGSGGAGALFANNGSGVDSDVDGPALAISAVNGSGGNVGTQFTLPSGAKLTVGADGSYSYDPDGRFNYLISAATAAATGAVNSSALDSFTYTLAGGNTVTVTVNVTGVDGVGDELHGDAGANTITDLTGINQFRVQQGGNDSVIGQGGDDFIYFGGAFTAADSVDGGSGTDRVLLQGNYAGGVTLGATSAVGVEIFELLAGDNTTYGDPGTNFYDYSLTFPEAALALGQTMSIVASSLRVGEDLTLNGAAQTDSAFIVISGSGNDVISGGALSDSIQGGSGNDTLTGGGGIDQLFGGDGDDTLNADSLDITLNGGTGMSDRVVFAASGTTAATWVGIETLELQGGANLTLTGTQFTSNLPINAQILGTGTVTVNIDVVDQILLATNMPTAATVAFVINGSAGTDVVKAAHTTNTISGGDGSDQLRGGNVADVIVGGNGRDKIIGWGGADTLTGNADDDVFRYLAASDSGTGLNSDKITDFVAGTDKLDFRFLDSDLVTDGVQPYGLTFVGTTAFDGSGNAEIRYGTTGADITVELDLDGNGTADMQIVLQGIGGGTLTGGDFLL